jgi:hypothetical protein
MGIYSELVIGIQLKPDTPAKVIETLEQLCGIKITPNYPDDYEFPDHPLFQTEKGKRIFGYSRNLFNSIPGRSLTFVEYNKAYILTVRAHLKSYDLEYEYFLDWIAPYSQTGKDYLEFVGYIHNEDWFNPVLIYIHKGKVWVAEITPRLNISDLDDEEKFEPDASLNRIGARGFIMLKDYMLESR